MEKKIVKKRIPHNHEWNALFRGVSLHQTRASYRNMLDNVHIGCYVEADDTEQRGTVVGIIKDRYGVPACLKVKYEEDHNDKVIVGYDYITVERITFYEPYNMYVPNDEYNDYDENDNWIYEDYGDCDSTGGSDSD